MTDLESKQARMRDRQQREEPPTEALYSCEICKSRRTYGRIDSTPGYLPVLNCSRCGKLRRHSFSQLIDVAERQ